MMATNPAHDAPTATPALITTVLVALPFGAQYIVNDQMPAATGCAGRLLSDQTPTAPLRRHALALAPGVGSRDPGVQLGAAPVPWRYRGFPAALTTGACVDAMARLPNRATNTPTTSQPSTRGCFAATGTAGSEAPAVAAATGRGRFLLSQRRSM